MRLTLAALLAAAVAAGSTPAAACNYLRCVHKSLSDDYYPAGQPRLPETVREVVHARNGRGLSLAGFYNDPSLALSRPAPAAYDYAPAPAYAPAPVYAPPPEPAYAPAPEPAYVQAPEPAYEPAPEPGFAPAPLEGGYERRRHRGPHVILSPFGRHPDEGRRFAHERRRPNVY